MNIIKLRLWVRNKIVFTLPALSCDCYIITIIFYAITRMYMYLVIISRYLVLVS